MGLYNIMSECVILDFTKLSIYFTFIDRLVLHRNQNKFTFSKYKTHMLVKYTRWFKNQLGGYTFSSGLPLS